MQNLNIAINDRVWPDWCLKNVKLRDGVYAIETFTFENLNTELEHGFKWQSMTWPWLRQKVNLRKGCVLLKGLTIR